MLLHPLNNPFNPNLPTRPEAVAEEQRARQLNEMRFKEAKFKFARLLFERPGAEPYDLVRIIFPAEQDAAYCQMLATQWPDNEILALLENMKRPGNDNTDLLPDRDALAMRYMQIADNPRVPADTRLKALGQYQTLMGMDPPKTGMPGINAGGNVNIVDARRVFVLPNNMTPEQWEAKNSPSRPVKQLELTVNDDE